MPRKAKRDGGGQDPSRSTVQPKRAPSGLPQGERQALTQAQSAIPLPNVQGQMQQAIQAAQAAPAVPTDLLSAPTARPDEPVQAGLPMGPGPGPEAIQPIQAPATEDDHNMARYLPMLEALADQPGATAATRNWVRRMRGSLSPNVMMPDIFGQQPQQ